MANFWQTSMFMQQNLSFFAIPAYWILTLVPHNYAISVMKKANNNRWNNSNPRSSKWDQSLRDSTPAEAYGRYERAEAAHKNGMENFPVFVGAILAGTIAKLNPSTLNSFVVAYLLSRVAYTYVYVSVTSHRYSYFRTAIWLVGATMCLTTYTVAGLNLA
ncbi:hypothetical protein D0Z07_0122 [Hyphodiscus hymeniophilus]|uniref:Uncharacterized protein n=1 Tax=Hyphodiscus hymeniophilus TaxID=353542 RepID=A0A9P6VR27_9HELO|nr:hypothetical protein D0Z07_0122 [Hyphodiscus hymeniophilus]